MTITPRESVLALATVGVILFGGGVMLARPKITEWRDIGAKCDLATEEIQGYQEFVAQRPEWETKFLELSEQLPRHPAAREVDVYWLEKMDELATKHGFQIAQRNAGEEVDQGDVYELAIDCRDWQGSLEQVVGFLFELQSEGAMFDIRQLLIKPKGKGVLRGRFSLSCAYTREEAETSP
jgi:hypothetical protein